METFTWSFEMICSSEENQYTFSTDKVKKSEEEYMIR